MCASVNIEIKYSGERKMWRSLVSLDFFYGILNDFFRAIYGKYINFKKMLNYENLCIFEDIKTLNSIKISQLFSNSSNLLHTSVSYFYLILNNSNNSQNYSIKNSTSSTALSDFIYISIINFHFTPLVVFRLQRAQYISRILN